MSVPKLNLLIPQGTTFSRALQVIVAGVATNLTTPINNTFRGMIRTSYEAVAPLLSFTFTKSGDNLTVTWSLTDTQTATLPATQDKDGADATDPLVYDIERVYGGQVDRVLQGQIRVTPEATK